MLAATVLMADTTPAAAAAATTVSPATVTGAAAPDKTADKPKLICKSEPVIGSLISKKTCYTSDQMAQRRQDERQNLEKMQNQIGLQVH
jgi:3-oxoacyl-ACP reductase-like protein